jgi:hypothetical protein
MRAIHTNLSCRRSGRASSRSGLAAALAIASLVCLTAGCGKHEPSYKDRIGTVDPATAPIIMPGAPKPPTKKQ